MANEWERPSEDSEKSKAERKLIKVERRDDERVLKDEPSERDEASEADRSPRERQASNDDICHHCGINAATHDDTDAHRICDGCGSEKRLNEGIKKRL